MKVVILTLALAGFLFVSLILGNAALAQQPPDNIEGNWTIYSNNIKNGDLEVKHLQIQQYGNRITGYFEGPYQAGPIYGEVDVHHVRFSTVTRNVLTFRGQIYGDNITGTYGLNGKHATWQAIRTPEVGLAVPPATVVTYQPQPLLTPAPAPVTTYQQPAQAPPAPPPAPAPQTQTQPVAATEAQTTSSDPTPAPLTPDQLDALVAPIALYPDALVAQVLAAAGFPEQAAFADYWMSQNKNLTGTALAQAVDQEPWDPSIKALTQFPSVLHDLASNMTWTSNLGQAVHDQQSDVMAAVQVMRAKAQAAGTLQSTSQITVTQQTPGTIVIQPASPQVVYVPQYNPAVVYGVPYVVPYYTPSYVAAGLSFGAGIAIGAAIGGGGFVGGGGGFGWGWGAWGCNWGGGGGGTVIYNHNTYINNHNWHGGNYNNYHPWGPHGNDPNGPHHYDPNGWQPNGGHNGDHGLIGGKGGVQHPPDGGHNGDHGLIGGNGGVQHPPDGGHNGDHGMIGGSGGVQHTNASDSSQRSHMSGDGNRTRSESNRGRSSMHPGGGMYRAPHHAEVHHSAPHHSAPHSSGGGHHR
jgi:Protein of unknown function (DUF3300)